MGGGQPEAENSRSVALRDRPACWVALCSELPLASVGHPAAPANKRADRHLALSVRRPFRAVDLCREISAALPKTARPGLGFATRPDHQVERPERASTAWRRIGPVASSCCTTTCNKSCHDILKLLSSSYSSTYLQTSSADEWG
jgi:hypothetical protein